MKPQEKGIIDATVADTPGAPRARMMLQRARWAATAFAEYDRERVRAIVQATAEVAYQNAERFAREAVEETGMGVAEHKLRKNEACSRGLLERYGDHDYVGAQTDADRKLVRVPKPAGVVLALTPSTNPVASVYFKVLLCLMTRNAVVVSPHPMARHVCAEATRAMAAAAVGAGAPDGCVQVVEEPTIPLIEALMADPGTDLIVATGGNAVVRAAYRSGNPALGVGPGNIPALVDASADVPRAAACLVQSKSFDNSILCTNESTAIVEEAVADRFVAELRRHGAHVLQGEEIDRVRDTCYPEGRLQTKLAGRSAVELADAAGVRIAAGTKVLVAPFEMIVPEEPLAHEKLFPLLGLVRVADARRGIEAARALIRIGGAGHSAVIHSCTRETVLAFGAAMRVLRVTVNAPGSTGASGMDTHLSPAMTIGTGFFGGSSLTDNLQPRDLVQWTSVAYASDPKVPFDDFTGLDPWSAAPPAAASRPAAPAGAQARTGGATARPVPAVELPGPSVEELRRLIRDELRELVKG